MGLYRQWIIFFLILLLGFSLTGCANNIKSTTETASAIENNIIANYTLSDSQVLNIVEKYEPQIPKVNIESGTFDAPQTIEFEQPRENEDIYYSLDSSMPTKNSKKYVDKFTINEGKTVLRAVVINDTGIKSDEIRYEYEIDIPLINNTIEIPINNEIQRKLNIFISNFSESNLKSFAEGSISNQELLHFGFFHNYYNYCSYNGSIRDNFEYSNGDVILNKKYIDVAVKKYFNIENIQHEEIEDPSDFEYDYDHIYIDYKNDEEYSYAGSTRFENIYSVVYKLEDIGDGQYIVYAKTYRVSADYNGSNYYDVYSNSHGDMYSLTFEESERMYNEMGDGERVEMVKAKIKKINEDGKERYILLEYNNDELQ